MRRVKTGYGATKYRLDKRERQLKVSNRSNNLLAKKITEIKIALKGQEQLYDTVALFDFVETNLNVPRLMAAAKEFNIGKDALVEFLASKGFNREDLKPTSKLTIAQYLELIKALNKDRLARFEISPTDSVTNSQELAISLLDGRLIVKAIKSDGSVVWSSGIEATSGLFVPAFNKYSELIKEFEDLINDSNVTEDALQKFLERNHEFIIDTEFKEAIPQALIITEEHSWEADFVLVPFDQNELCKIIELKLPNVSLARSEKNGHPRFTSKLLHAIQQLKDYAKAFQSKETRDRFKTRYGTDVYRPDLQLIIGRKGETTLKQTFIDKQKDEGIRITDWDTFLEKARRRLK